MKLTDEQTDLLERDIKFFMLRTMFNLMGEDYDKIKNARSIIKRLQADRQAWKEEAAENEKALLVTLDRIHDMESEMNEIHGRLNQAVEVLEWIRDAGTDYQSINKAASFLSSLSQETEVNHETGWDIGKSQEKA